MSEKSMLDGLTKGNKQHQEITKKLKKMYSGGKMNIDKKIKQLGLDLKKHPKRSVDRNVILSRIQALETAKQVLKNEGLWKEIEMKKE